MKKIVVVIGLCLLLFVSRAECATPYMRMYTCSYASQDVLLHVNYGTGGGDEVMTSNRESVLVHQTGSGMVMDFYLHATTDDMGGVMVTSGVTTLDLLSCTKDVDLVWYNGLMGLAGALSAGLLFYSIQQAFL